MDRRKGCWTLCYFILLSSGCICTEAEGSACESYMNLTDWHRSTGYGNDDFEHVNLCDRQLTAGWYRASTPAGGDMPLASPGFNKCGTVYPIWLDPQTFPGLPTVEGAVVGSDACVTGVFDSCATKIGILVMNCGDFNVYYLKPSTSCPEAYCFGSEAKCPPGYSSSTGFTPGCDGKPPPVLTATPRLWNETESLAGPLPGSSYHATVFLCGIDTPDIQEDIWFDVTFYIGSERVYRVTKLQENDMPARLYESEFPKFQDDNHQPNLGYGNNLRCRVQGRWSADEDPGNSAVVSEHFGFEIISPQPIEVEEGEEAEILIRSRLPFPCPSWDPACNIMIALLAPRYHSDFKKCQADDQFSHLILKKTGCKFAMQADDWPSPSAMTVNAAVDSLIGKGARRMVVKMFADQNSWKPSLSNLELPPVTVIVKDTAVRTGGMMCHALVDPHMQLFHGLRWEGQFYTGEFILYKNTHTDSEVQVRFAKCNGAATCICAVMVRAGKSLYIIDTCGGRYHFFSSHGKYGPRAKLYDCDEGRSNMLIEKKGKMYKFIFSSGTIVTVYFQTWIDFHNVYVKPSVADYQKSYGLCGHIVSSSSSVFALRNGAATSSPRNFMANWKVSTDERLWQGKSTASSSPVYYCGCDDGEIECAATAEHYDCVDKWYNDKEYSNCRNAKRRKRSLADGGGSRAVQSDDIVDDDDDIAYDYEDEDIIEETVEWKNGWNEASARSFCEDYILGRESVQVCDTVPNVNQQEAIDTCILDIKLTGDTDASSSHVESIKEQCLDTVSNNISLWQVDPDDDGGASNETMVPPITIIQASCPDECNDRGSCVKGECVCDEGYSGLDCSRNDSAVPWLFRLPYEGVCDLQRWACQATLVYGNDVFDSEDLACQIQLYEVTAEGIEEVGSEEIVESELERPSAAVCSLSTTPAGTLTNANTKVLGLAFGIRMSNNRKHFSNPMMMVAYDSKCSNCTNTGYENITCEKKEAVCRIGGQCYDDMEYKYDQSCLVCDVAQSASDWSKQDDTCYIENQCYQLNEARTGQTCLRCRPQSSQAAWTQLPDTCLIDGGCYSSGAKNPSNQCQSCQPDSSPTSWTHILGCSGGSEPGNSAVSIRPAPLLFVFVLLLAA